MSFDALSEWVGKEKTVEDTITSSVANQMNALLSRDHRFQDGNLLPPLWHWLYFHDVIRSDRLGNDGHEELGSFLPPVPLPRRMWAGGKVNFTSPVIIGERAQKRSRIQSVEHKQGRSGSMFFVVVAHEIMVSGELCISEEQTLVYLEARTPDEGRVSKRSYDKMLDGAAFSREVVQNPITLFRYSSLTNNAHRIHYDVDFCREEEGYPGLVVHGPLNATLLVDLFYQQFSEDRITAFDYRGLNPVFAFESYTLNGKRDDEFGKGWIVDQDGYLIMQASLTLA